MSTNAEYQMPDSPRSYEAISVAPVEYGVGQEQYKEIVVLQNLGDDIELTRAQADIAQILPERKKSWGRNALTALINMNIPRAQRKMNTNDLIDAESWIGAEIVGNDDAPETRKFFYEKDHNWFYIIIGKDEKGRTSTKGYRFEVNHDHVLLIEDGANHQPIGDDEMSRLVTIASHYHERVLREVYKKSPHETLAPVKVAEPIQLEKSEPVDLPLAA